MKRHYCKCPWGQGVPFKVWIFIFTFAGIYLAPVPCAKEKLHRCHLIRGSVWGNQIDKWPEASAWQKLFYIMRRKSCDPTAQTDFKKHLHAFNSSTERLKIYFPPFFNVPAHRPALLNWTGSQTKKALKSKSLLSVLRPSTRPTSTIWQCRQSAVVGWCSWGGGDRWWWMGWEGN